VRAVLERVRPNTRRLLDLGCGTGRHAFELEKIGFRVEGSDTSASMIGKAREQARARNSRVVFHQHSFQTADRIAGPFDGVISMFSSIGYLTDSIDVATALQNVRSLLVAGGVFLFDYWNGNAVVRDYSPVRVVRASDGDVEILRVSETHLDLIAQVAEVKMTCMTFVGERRSMVFEELHKVRFFYFREMETLLRDNGFTIVHKCPFLELDAPLQPYDWNVTIAAIPDETWPDRRSA